jgi:dephospho-CoA kinase
LAFASLLVYNEAMKTKYLLIGLVGQSLAGKDTVAKHLVDKYDFSYISTGDIVRAYVTKHQLGDLSLDNLQLVANRLREQFGADYLAKIALQEFQQNLIVSGLRNPAEVHLLQQHKATILAITASQEARYLRASKRQNKKDYGDFTTFITRDDYELDTTNPNGQNLKAVISLGDIFIDNDDSQKVLIKKVDEIMTQLKKNQK